MTIEIVLFNRGNILVGEVSMEDDDLVVRHGAVVRRWGTNAGLGQLAALGKQEKTVLDPTEEYRAHYLTVVGRHLCNRAAWTPWLEERKGRGLDDYRPNL